MMRHLGTPLYALTEVGSTMDVARELAQHGASEGTCVMADRQTGGRGRSGRRWESPPGGLYASLIQVVGRAARHIHGEAILYADHRTGSIDTLVRETNRRRQKQLDYNRQHGITPTTITKAIRDGIEAVRDAEDLARQQTGQNEADYQAKAVISELEEEMLTCASNLQFERAAMLRDQIRILRERGEAANPSAAYPRRASRR